MLQVQAGAVALPPKAGWERQRDMPERQRGNGEGVTTERKMLLLSAHSRLTAPGRLSSKLRFQYCFQNRLQSTPSVSPLHPSEHWAWPTTKDCNSGHPPPAGHSAPARHSSSTRGSTHKQPARLCPSNPNLYFSNADPRSVRILIKCYHSSSGPHCHT